MQVPGLKEEWGVAGGGEMGAVTEIESEAQMQQEQPKEATLTSASTPGLAVPAPTQEASTKLALTSHKNFLWPPHAALQHGYV